MPKQKINVLPALRNILAGCYDPNGAYDKVDEKTGQLIYTKGAPPTGSISLSALDAEAYQKLCAQVKYKPEGPAQEVGGGGQIVLVKDLAAAIAKAGPEDEVLIAVDGE